MDDLRLEELESLNEDKLWPVCNFCPVLGLPVLELGDGVILPLFRPGEVPSPWLSVRARLLSLKYIKQIIELLHEDIIYWKGLAPKFPVHIYSSYVNIPAPEVDVRRLLLVTTQLRGVVFLPPMLGSRSSFHQTIRSPAVTNAILSCLLKRISRTQDSWSLRGGYNLRHSLPTSNIWKAYAYKIWKQRYENLKETYWTPTT